MVEMFRTQAGTEALARAVSRWTQDREVFATAISGLTLYRSFFPGEPANCVYEPCIGLIVQGEKKVSFAREDHVLRSGRFFATSIDLPTSAQITEATPERPYLSLVLELDLAMVSDVLETVQSPGDDRDWVPARGLVVSASPPELVDAFVRLLSLLDRPDELSIMAGLVKREIYFRLLKSEAGPWLRRMVSQGYRSNGMLRVLEWLKRHYDKPLDIGELAERAGMARSTLHHNFRHLTGTSPLQYQKSLRLYAARNMMKTERLDANTAAIRVGYESVSQFNREYARMFGNPPGRDMRSQRNVTEETSANLFVAAE